MRFADVISLTAGSVTAHRLRAFLTALGIAIGVTAVVLLTSIGEGVHRFVLTEFTQFGTNIVGVSPGKAKTFGGSIGAFGNTRPLTVEDAQALERVPYATASVPVIQGDEPPSTGSARSSPPRSVSRSNRASSCRRTTRARRAASPCSVTRCTGNSSATAMPWARSSTSAGSATASSA